MKDWSEQQHLLGQRFDFFIPIDLIDEQLEFEFEKEKEVKMAEVKIERKRQKNFLLELQKFIKYCFQNFVPHLTISFGVFLTKDVSVSSNEPSFS